ncbi:AAA family ATPase [Burkholderia multivorans]|uniref:AAA family ATPase n=1 Tax=Burkholderia multivorans TaxID=87883 RepID=UPI00207C72E3|nr:AAA family ATPase [Burkholderia multivorans]MCO1451158.1 AAA family ATPase [Burkholderia multivorans]
MARPICGSAACSKAAARRSRFIARRGRSSLRTPDDDKLPDDYLATVLDGATREFFEQMFGLATVGLSMAERILDASDKLGQVLFESAAGVGRSAPCATNSTHGPRNCGRRGAAAAHLRLPKRRSTSGGRTEGSAGAHARLGRQEGRRAKRSSTRSRWRARSCGGSNRCARNSSASDGLRRI